MSIQKEMSNRLYAMAIATPDVRHKRYLLEEARKIEEQSDPTLAQVRLNNLVIDAKRRFKDAGFLDGFFTGVKEASKWAA